MKDLIQASTIFIGTVAIAVTIFVFLIGWQAFIIGLSVIGLLVYGAGCAIGGAWWTERTIQRGAGIALTSTSKNDEYDTRKIEALTGLAEAVVKGYAQTQNSMLRMPSTQLPQTPYPQLPANSALRFDDAVFEELD